MAWNSSPGTLPGSGKGECPARIFTPGAVTSGLMMSDDRRFGPRDENPAMNGASTSVYSPAVSCATGLALAAM